MKRHHPTVAFVLIACAACAVDVYLLAMLVTGAWAASEAVPVHIGLVLGISSWTYASRSCRQDLRLPLLLATMTCFLGPFGAAGVLVTAALTVVGARSARPFEEWYASLFPEAEGRSGVWEQLMSRTGDDTAHGSVAPFVDILSFGDLPRKQRLITLVAGDFRPAFAHVLRLALNDSSNAIRVQAASAITRIEDEFLERSVRLSSAVQQDPLDASRLLALATFNDEYASSGILDDERAQEARRHAARAYVDYLQLQPRDTVVRCAVGRLLLRSGRPREAAPWLDPGADDASATPQPLLLHMEALFALGRFDELRKIASARYPQTSRRDDVPIETLETMQLWAGHGATVGHT